MTTNRTSELLRFLHDLTEKGVTVKVFTKDPDSWAKKNQSANKECIRMLKAHGVEVVFRGNMHEKAILIDEKITWFGSLNALSYTGQTGEWMFRNESREVYEKIAESLDLRGLNATIETTADNPQGKIICPVCGDPMIAKEGSNGKIYWECMNDGLTWNPGEMFPYGGQFLCPKCKKPLEFSMQNQPRWRCPDHKNKHKVVRWNELRLPNMRKKIPSSDIPRVLEYFKKTKKDFDDLTKRKKARSIFEELQNISVDESPATTSEPERQMSFFDEQLTKNKTRGAETSNDRHTLEGENKTSLDDLSSFAVEDRSIIDVFGDERFKPFIRFCELNNYMIMSDLDMLLLSDILSIPGISIDVAAEIIDIIEQAT